MATPKRRRPVVGSDGLGQSPLQVAATPVDRQRVTDGGRNLLQIAEGLSKFSPTLARLHDITVQRQGARDKASGEQRARELWEEGKTFKQAVESGLISRSDSPWFRVGAEEFFGRQAGTAYREFFREKLRESPVRNSTEVSDFDEFEREVRQEFVDGVIGKDNRQTSTAFANSFGRMAEAMIDNERNAFSADAGRRLEEQTEDAFHSSVMTATLDIASGDISREDARAQIQDDLRRMIQMGTTDKGTINRTAAEGIINAARRMNDLELLGLLEEIETVPGETLLTTKGVTDMVERAEREILQQIDGENSRANAERDRARAEESRNLTSSLVSDFFEHGPASIANDDPRLKRLAAVDPSAATGVLSARTAAMSNMNASNPEAVDQLVLGIYNGQHTTLQPAVDAMAAGMIDQQGLNVYMQHLQQAVGSDGRSAADAEAFQEKAYKDAEKRLLREAGATDFNITNAEEHVQAAVGHLRREWFRRYRQGANELGWEEQDKILTDMVDLLSREFTTDITSADPLGANNPAGPGGGSDPLWQQMPFLTPEVYGPLTQKISTMGIRGTTREERRLLQGLGVEFVPGDEAATNEAILQALRQQEFLYRQATLFNR